MQRLSEVYNLLVTMDGIAKFHDVLDGCLKDNNAVCRGKEFGILLGNLNLDVLNDPPGVVYFIDRELEANGTMTTEHFRKAGA